MRRFLITVGILSLGTFLVLRLYPPSTTVQIGEKAPGFTLSDDADEPVALDSFLGKVVLLNFWATSCPPCLAEMPSFEKLYQRFKEEGLLILAVNEDSKENVRFFKRQVPFTFPVLYDVDHVAIDHYGITVLPQTFIIGRDGVVLKIISGTADWTGPYFLNIITEALK